MPDDDYDSDDIEIIRAQILKFPGKEFYPGLSEDLRAINEALSMRAQQRKRQRPNSGLWQERSDLSLKAHLIQQWRRQQARMKPPQQANDNNRPGEN